MLFVLAIYIKRVANRMGEAIRYDINGMGCDRKQNKLPVAGGARCEVRVPFCERERSNETKVGFHFIIYYFYRRTMNSGLAVCTPAVFDIQKNEVWLAGRATSRGMPPVQCVTLAAGSICMYGGRTFGCNTNNRVCKVREAFCG